MNFEIAFKCNVSCNSFVKQAINIPFSHCLSQIVNNFETSCYQLCDNLATVGVEFRSWQHKAVTVCYICHDCISLVGTVGAIL